MTQVYRKRVTHKAFRLAPLLLALALAAPAAVAQAPVVVTGPGRVTIRASNIPLGDLLQQLSVLVTMDRLKIAPDALATPVTVEIEDTPVEVAMLEVLKASSVDYVLTGTRLLAGGTSQAALTFERKERPALSGAAPTPLLPRYEDPADNTPEKRAAEMSTGFLGGGGDAGAPGGGMSVASDDTADQFGFLVGVEAVKFRVVGDSAVIETPGFVPYKMRPEVIARRLATDVGKVP